MGLTSYWTKGFRPPPPPPPPRPLPPPPLLWRHQLHRQPSGCLSVFFFWKRKLEIRICKAACWFSSNFLPFSSKFWPFSSNFKSFSLSLNNFGQFLTMFKQLSTIYKQFWKLISSKFINNWQITFRYLGFFFFSTLPFIFRFSVQWPCWVGGRLAMIVFITLSSWLSLSLFSLASVVSLTLASLSSGSIGIGGAR